MSAPDHTGRGDIAWSRQLAGISAGMAALWTVAGLVMFTAHAGAGWWAMRDRPVVMADEPPPAIMVDLASVPMAPAAVEEQVAMDEVDAAAAEAVETAEPVEPVEEAEVVEALEPPDLPETVEPVEPVEPEPAETAEPVEPVEEAPAAVAMAAEAVDPTLPEEVEPVEQAEVTATRAEVIEPEMLEPVEEANVPLPTARPEPTPQELAQVTPRQTRQDPPRRQEQTRPRQPQQSAPSRQQNRAQTQTAQTAPRAAAPQAASGSGAAVSPARWQSRLMAHLERRKRYPAAARRSGSQGTAQVRFSIDANGNVQSVSLARSSGVPELDAEVLALVRRASPVPAPPPGVSRTISVPIRFSLR